MHRSAPGVLKIGSEGQTNNSWLNIDFSSWADGVKLSADGTGSNIWFDTSMIFSNDRLMIFGTGTNSLLFFHGHNSPDIGALKLALGTPGTMDSEYFVISHGDDMLLRPSAQPANPTLRIFSRDGTNSPTDTVDIYHDQTDAKIDVGSGDLVIETQSDLILKTQGGGLFIDDSTTAPTPQTNRAGIYSSGGVLHSADANGNNTQISPHNNQGEWVFYSKNTKTGRIVEINMEKLVKAVEKLSGEQFMVETWEKK